MEKQKETKKENQRSEILVNVSPTKGKNVFTLTCSIIPIFNTLLVQNTIKGPPGRSRSPGTEEAYPMLVQTNLLLFKQFIFMVLQTVKQLLKLKLLSTF